MIENEVLGKLERSKQKRSSPTSLYLWFLGASIGSILFIFILLFKAFAIRILWNALMLNQQPISFSEAYGLTSIITLITMRYPGESQLEAIIDLLIKVVLFSFVAIILVL